MPIPTLQSVPKLGPNEKPELWARRLTAYIEQHISQFMFLSQRIVLGNGSNHNIDTKAGMLVHIMGPTGAFSISGIGKGSEGRILVLHNDSSGTMTLKHNNSGSAVGNRIYTSSAADETAVISLLIYDNEAKLWFELGGTGGGAPGPGGSGDDTLDWLGL
jgi:hypothetical protein